MEAKSNALTPVMPTPISPRREVHSAALEQFDELERAAVNDGAPAIVKALHGLTVYREKARVLKATLRAGSDVEVHRLNCSKEELQKQRESQHHKTLCQIEKENSESISKDLIDLAANRQRDSLEQASELEAHLDSMDAALRRRDVAVLVERYALGDFQRHMQIRHGWTEKTAK